MNRGLSGHRLARQSTLFIYRTAGQKAAALVALYQKALLADSIGGLDRDRGAPLDATPPTPPGIRVRTAAVRPSYAWAEDS